MANVIVVGGGLAGIVAAYFSRLQGHNVSVIDRGESLGGLLRSHTNQWGSFDYGTHIASSTDIQTLNDFLFDGFTDENCHIFDTTISGSYYGGKLNENSPYISPQSLPEPIFHKICYEVLTASENREPTCLTEYFRSKFGNTLTANVLNPVAEKYMGEDGDTLDIKVHCFFDLNRVLLFDGTTSNILKSIDTFNQKIGFHHHEKGVKKYYPSSGGIGAWIGMLVHKLINLGVEIVTEEHVTNLTVIDKKIVQLTTSNQNSFRVDTLIWALPKGLLCQHIDVDHPLKPPEFRKVILFDFLMNNPLNSECHYINVHDPVLKSCRITLYQNLNPTSDFYACTVEVLTGKTENAVVMTNDILEELRLIGLLDKNTNVLHTGSREVLAGFPILRPGQAVPIANLSRELDAKIDNCTFVGRGNDGAFFMSEVLAQAYEKTMGI